MSSCNLIVVRQRSWVRITALVCSFQVSRYHCGYKQSPGYLQMSGNEIMAPCAEPLDIWFVHGTWLDNAGCAWVHLNFDLAWNVISKFPFELRTTTQQNFGVENRYLFFLESYELLLNIPLDSFQNKRRLFASFWNIYFQCEDGMGYIEMAPVWNNFPMKVVNSIFWWDPESFEPYCQ